jgi:solute carrier family 25 uncoupling protein 27
VTMGELACYDHAKRFIIQNQIAQDNIYAHTLASIMSSLSTTALSCPVDVVKTRKMNQATDKEGKMRLVRISIQYSNRVFIKKPKPETNLN